LFTASSPRSALWQRLDGHPLEHLRTWTTLLPCAKHEQAVIEHLRSSRRAYVVPWGLLDELRRPLAA
jgi:hypothetical protein